jgi:hypothetical protein
MKGIGQGFSQFFDNFAEHMIRGFLSWLLGDLKDVQIPKEISVKSIITFFLQLMGITWPNIRKILAKKIGEKNVALIEKVYSLITMLMDQGPQGIYEMIKDKLDPQSIVDQVVQMAVDYMVTAIAKQVAVRVALLFNPAGAIIQAIEAIYRVLKWVFQNAAKIFTLIETIVNGLADIISGNIGGFAKAVERGLEMLIAPVLGFIADYFSLGDLPQMVAKQIKSFREWILGKIEAGFDWLIAKGKALLAALGIGKKEKDKKGGSEGELDAIGENVAFAAAGESHHLWVERHGANGVLMVASAKQPLEKFFASPKVKAALKFHQGKQLPSDIANAQAMLSKTDHDLDALAIEIENIKKEKEVDPKGSEGDKLKQQNETVKTEQRSLAEVLVRIFEALQIPEPIADEHPVKRTEGPAAPNPEQSHHVPAKALGQVIKEFFVKAQDRLKTGEWEGDPMADAVAAALDVRLMAIGKLSDGEGDKLSAILLSHAHREEGGAHSKELARYLAPLTSGAEALLVVRRTTESELKKFSSFISVNPQKPGWRAFLADVHTRNENKSHETRPDQPRTEANAIELIIGKAEKAFAAVSKKTLDHGVVQPVNRMLERAPDEAFRTGRAAVEIAMEAHEEGTPTGRRNALSQLRRVYSYSWQPFSKQITVEWP